VAVPGFCKIQCFGAAGWLRERQSDLQKPDVEISKGMPVNNKNFKSSKL